MSQLPAKVRDQSGLLLDKADAERKTHIKRLPPGLVNRIAAGEVVERPAAVIKELVENALDAGASRIAIEAGAGGRSLRVADNGCGIAKEELSLAFENHATSKLHNESDLESIATLGFRGEALASIAAISRLTCISKPAAQDAAWQWQSEGGVNTSLGAASGSDGTVFNIQDLFFNTPARLKFLKRPSTELAHIEETVQGLALAHPAVRFSLTVNGKASLATTGSSSLLQTVAEVYNLDVSKQRKLFTVDAEDAKEGLLLQAVMAEPTAKPLLYRSKTQAWSLLVNGRLIRCPVLSKAVEAAFTSLLEERSYPLVVLQLQINPTLLDVNVHPTKREVRHAKPSILFAFVRSALRKALEDRFQSSVANQWQTQPNRDPIAEESSHSSDGSQTFYKPVVYSRASQLEAMASQAEVTAPLPWQPAYTPVKKAAADKPLAVQQALLATAPVSSALTAANSATVDCSVNPASGWKVLGQLYQTYVLLETRLGLMIVDQHIASERYCYERLKQQVEGADTIVQTFTGAEQFPLSPRQAALLQEHEASLTKLGFAFDLRQAASTESLQVCLLGAPVIYPERKQLSPRQQFLDLIEQLEHEESAQLNLEYLLSTLACHTAIRAGDVLNASQMEALVQQWLACRLPWSCPHGRPIAHTLEASTINQFFHRPSLPVGAFK